MSDVTASSGFVSKALVPERSAPVKTTGFVGFLRTQMFNSPTNILLTVLGALLIWFTVIPAFKFLLLDAVWQGPIVPPASQRTQIIRSGPAGRSSRRSSASSCTASIPSRSGGGST